MKNKITLIISSIILMMVILTLASAQGVMTRTASSVQVSPGSQFTITYSASGAGTTFGASIVDNIIGSCTFPNGGQAYQSVMLSDDGISKTVTLTAPQSGSCTLQGNYKFGTDEVVNFPDLTINIGNSNGTVCTMIAPNCQNGTTLHTDNSGTCPVYTCVNETNPSFDINKPLFKIFGFDVTWLILIIAIIIIVIVTILLAK